MKISLNIFLAVLFLFPLAGEAQDLHTRAKDLPCLNKNFNVFAHIVLDSLRQTGITTAAIEADLASTNKYFAPICVTFSLCGIDTIHNYNYDSIATSQEYAEVTGYFTARDRINIFITGELDEPTKCGFASLGGVASNGYIYLKKGCTPGTLVHEMGHYFGLPHTFEGNGDELVNGSNCETAGDGLCDTPADPYDPNDEEAVYLDGCEFIYLGLDDNGEFYQPDVGNIMSYYGCDCGFTRDQYLKMAETYNSSAKKLW